MNSLIVVFALSLSASIPRAAMAQAPLFSLLEAQAIARVQQTPLSQFDPALPNRPFGKWFEQLAGPAAGVSWQLNDCGEPAEADRERGLAACVEVTAILPNDRMVAMAAEVGSFKLGVTGAPRLRFIAVEDFGRLRKVARLSELPGILRQPPARPARSTERGARLPPARIIPLVGLVGLVGPSGLSYKPPPPDAAPIRLAADPESPPPPPESAPANLRVSEGALLANAVTKVVPIYPSVARQISASGDVKVQVTIGEDGKVLEAAAISGHPLLRTAAEDAARRWVFKPATFNGRPILSQGTLTFVFKRP